jgi:hypothetical protein
VGIDKAGQDNFTGAVDLGDFLAIPLEPGISQRVFGRAYGDDRPPDTENRTSVNDVEFFEGGTAPRTRRRCA